MSLGAADDVNDDDVSSSPWQPTSSVILLLPDAAPLKLDEESWVGVEVSDEEVESTRSGDFRHDDSPPRVDSFFITPPAISLLRSSSTTRLEADGDFIMTSWGRADDDEGGSGDVIIAVE